MAKKEVSKKKKAVAEVVTKKKKAVAEVAVKKVKKSKVESTKTSKASKAEKASKSKSAKVKVAKPLPTYTPVKEKMKVTALIEHLSEVAEVEKKEVKRVIEALSETILGSIVKKGAGEFMFPGLFKVVTIKKPAVKGGKSVKNPFKPGEMMITKDKPATVKVKVRPMKKMKDAALV